MPTSYYYDSEFKILGLTVDFGALPPESYGQVTIDAEPAEVTKVKPSTMVDGASVKNLLDNPTDFVVADLLASSHLVTPSLLGTDKTTYWAQVDVATTEPVDWATELQAGEVIDDHILVDGQRILLRDADIRDEQRAGIYICRTGKVPKLDQKAIKFLGLGSQFAIGADYKGLQNVPDNCGCLHVYVKYGTWWGGAIFRNNARFSEPAEFEVWSRSGTQPRSYIYSSSDQPVATGVSTKIAFTLDWYDIGNLHNVDITTILNVTQANPAQVTTLTVHGLTTGDEVYVHDVEDTVSANGLWTVTVIDDSTLTLDGCNTTGDPAYDDGGGVVQKDATKIFVPRRGMYKIDAQVSWGADGVGGRWIRILSDDVVMAKVSVGSFGDGNIHQQVGWQNGIFTPGTVIELEVMQDSGDSLDVLGGLGETWLSLTWIDEE